MREPDSAPACAPQKQSTVSYRFLSFFALLLLALLALTACGDEEDFGPAISVSGAAGFATDAAGGESGRGSSGGGGTSNGQGGEAGLVTAGEWRDLENWDYWTELLEQQREYHDQLAAWGVNPAAERVSVRVTDRQGEPLANATVELMAGGRPVFTARTDNRGRAELFAGFTQPEPATDLRLSVDRQLIPDPVSTGGQVNTVVVSSAPLTTGPVEIAFIVDATGSMGDELHFLQQDLRDVIRRVETENNIAVHTASVFYRDEGDEYVTRRSPFTPNIAQTDAFINDQVASGGGDFPEAVHTALNEAVTELQWSELAPARIAFLLLDAPPHDDEQTRTTYLNTVRDAAARGIRVVPIVASGIDKPTEFLMRATAMATNGTYVFITDDSGIGNPHLVPTVGDYEVEFLNDLMVRVVGWMTE